MRQPWTTLIGLKRAVIDLIRIIFNHCADHAMRVNRHRKAMRDTKNNDLWEPPEYWDGFRTNERHNK